MDEVIDQESDEALRAILSAISNAPGDRQIPLLRSYLEHKLDSFEQYEIEYHDFIADSVLVASNRMQDLRLEVIEIRLSDLETPAFNMRDLVFDFAIMLGIELAVLMSPHLLTAAGAGSAGGLLSIIFRNRSKSNAIQRTARNLDTDLAEQAELLETLGREAAGLGNELSAAEQRIRAASQQFSSRRDAISDAEQFLKKKGLFEGPEIAKGKVEAEQLLKRDREAIEAAVRDKEDVLQGMKSNGTQLQHTRDQIELLQKQVDDLNLARKMLREEELKTKAFRDFWESDAFSKAKDTFQGRVAEDLGAFGQKVRTGSLQGPSGNDLVTRRFSPSEVVTDFLGLARQDRRNASIAFSKLRNLVRYTDENRFLDSPAIQELTRVIGAAVVSAKIDTMDLPTVRPALVEGIEFMLWAFWLSNSGKLTTSDGKKTIPSRSGGQDRTYSASDNAYFVDDILVSEIRIAKTSASPVGIPKTFLGTRYPMAGGFSEHITDYLYKTFAANFLKYNPVDLPFKYDEAEKTALMGAFGLSKHSYGVLENTERTRLMKTMSVLNTYAFLHFYSAMQKVTPDAFFNASGKSYGELMKPVAPELGGTALEETVELAAAKEQADIILGLSGLDAELYVMSTNTRIHSRAIDVENKIANLEFWSQTSAENTLYIQFSIAELGTAQDELKALVDSLEAQEDLTDLLDQPLMERARKALAYKADTSSTLPFGAGFDNQLGEFGSHRRQDPADGDTQ